MIPVEPEAHKQTLLLIGGGHAHVAVLADWIRRGPPAGTRTLLLTPHPTLRYSGMVPGWLAGQHTRDAGLVDLKTLAARAGVEWIAGACAGLDPVARTALTDAGETIAFDLAAIGTGGVGRGAALLGEDPRLIDVRPIDAFVQQLDGRSAPARVVVAGGGAGGVELAFGLRNLAAAATRPAVTLVAGKAGLLPGFAPAVQRRVSAAMGRQGIAVLAEDARIEAGKVMAGDRLLEPADMIVTALGSAAPAWLAASGLAVDAQGSVLVDAHQRSTSHPHILAAGDVAARADRPLAHSGVHAVFAGPVLAANLRQLLTGKTPRVAYNPRANSLYLINTGDGSAIASYGPFSAEGRWVLAVKHRIDKAWIAKYAALGAGV